MKQGKKFENYVAELRNGKTVLGSGCGKMKEDVEDGEFLTQTKEINTDKKSFSIIIEEMDKLRRHAAMLGKMPKWEVKVNGKHWVLIPTDVFEYIYHE